MKCWKRLWEQFGVIPMNPETGAHRGEVHGAGALASTGSEIWHWFDESDRGRCLPAVPVTALTVPRSCETSIPKQLCFECESSSCQFNHGGELPVRSGSTSA